MGKCLRIHDVELCRVEERLTLRFKAFDSQGTNVRGTVVPVPQTCGGTGFKGEDGNSYEFMDSAVMMLGKCAQIALRDAYGIEGFDRVGRDTGNGFMERAVLEQWSMRRNEDGDIIAVGKVYGRDGIKDGTKVCTRKVVAIKDGVLQVASGAQFGLGTPDPQFRKLLKTIDAAFGSDFSKRPGQWHTLINEKSSGYNMQSIGNLFGERSEFEGLERKFLASDAATQVIADEQGTCWECVEGRNAGRRALAKVRMCPAGHVNAETLESPSEEQQCVNAL